MSVDLGAGSGGNCAALSLERGLDLRKGAVVGRTLTLFWDTLQSIKTKSGRKISWNFILKYTRM